MSFAILALSFVPAYTFAPANALAPARVSQAPAIHHAVRSSSSVTMAQSDDAELVDRLFASAVYLFPITDGFQFGKFIYASVPPIGALAYNVAPIINAFDSIPFSGLIFFAGLSTLSRNPGLSRFLGSLQQAILLDIAFISQVSSAALVVFPLAMQQVGYAIFCHGPLDWLRVVLMRAGQDARPDPHRLRRGQPGDWALLSGFTRTLYSSVDK